MKHYCVTVTVVVKGQSMIDYTLYVAAPDARGAAYAAQRLAEAHNPAADCCEIKWVQYSTVTDMAGAPMVEVL